MADVSEQKRLLLALWDEHKELRERPINQSRIHKMTKLLEKIKRVQFKIAKMEGGL